MSIKKNNRYKILLQELELKDGKQSGKSIEFEFQNHDNIFSIIENIKKKQLFENKSESTEFIAGLKSFNDVVMCNKRHSCSPLFRQRRSLYLYA